MALLDFISARIPAWESNYCGSPPRSNDAATLRADYAYSAAREPAEDALATTVREAAGPPMISAGAPVPFSSHASW
jgi:hypothetical protein